jgi:predicted transposase/invertase (TIGR01784 family)
MRMSYRITDAMTHILMPANDYIITGDTYYSNLFAKVFTYLNQNDPGQNWRAVVIYERRSFEPEDTDPYEGLLNSHRVVRVYLDEIDSTTESSLGIQIVKLIFEKEKNAVNRGKEIIAEAQESLTDDKETEQVLELIQTILLYKLSNLSREELQAMLGIEEFSETRLGQELLTEYRQKLLSEIQTCSRVELQAMLGIEDFKQTRLAQDLLTEAKLEAVPEMLARGFTIEAVAEILKLELEQVRQVAEKEKS